jgi:hypothetical protein
MFEVHNFCFDDHICRMETTKSKRSSFTESPFHLFYKLFNL